MFDTHNIPEVLMKQFQLAFGFAQGERWFGSVVCDEHEDIKRIRSGTFEGDLVLISKQTLPSRRVRVSSERQEITVLDVNRDGTNMSITVPYNVRVDFREQCPSRCQGWSHCAY